MHLFFKIMKHVLTNNFQVDFLFQQASPTWLQTYRGLCKLLQVILLSGIYQLRKCYHIRAGSLLKSISFKF